MTNNKPKVIAISGVSGAGKTAAVKLLAKSFNCPYLLFDDHTDMRTYPQDMKRWLNNGANVSLIQTPKFVSALQALRSTNSSRFIFIEEPFGRERDSMSLLIDYVVFLDQPLELCLSRIIKRHTDNLTGDNSASLSSIANFLDKYQDHFREIYIKAANKVSLNCDLIISGNISIKDTENTISNWLKNHANQLETQVKKYRYL